MFGTLVATRTVARQGATARPLRGAAPDWAAVFRLLAFASLLVVLPSLSAWAGTPTLKTIAVDGNMADWAPVLSNPLQYTQDGTYAVPCGSTSPVDQDCVNGYLGGGNNGVDITGFAWTYDATNIYLYLRRAANGNSQTHFLFAMDVNHNNLMESVDYVLDVKWTASNGSTNISLYRYVPANAGGDNITSGPNGTGQADGYRLPGSLGALVWTDTTKYGGSKTSPEMETYVPWAQIGVPNGTSIYYHVSSNNNATLSGANDNLGGPGGGGGAFGYHGGSLTPSPTIQGTAPGGSVTYTITLTNTGTFTDTFTLAASSSMGYGASLSSTSIPLAPGATSSITLTVSTNALPASAVDTTTVQATCGGDGSVSSCVVTTNVGTVTLGPSASKTAVPGNPASYPLTLSNMLATDRFNFTVHSSAGFQIDLYAGATLIATSLTGNGTWNSITAGYDVDGNGQPDIGVFSGSTLALTAAVTPPGGTASGTVDTLSLGAAGFTNGGSGSVALTTTVEPRLLVTPTPLLQYTGAGMTIYFAHTLLNSWSAADSFGFSATSSAGYTVRIYSDPNGDGNPSDGVLVTGTGSVAANGGLFHFIVAVSIPAGVTPPAAGVTDTTTVTVTSGLTPSVTATVTDQTKVAYISPFQDSLDTVQATDFAPCATLYIGGFNLVPGASYGLIYKDPSGTVVRTVNVITADAVGHISDSNPFPADAASGSWTVSLTGGLTDTVSVALQRSATAALQPSPAGVPLSGSPLVASALLTDSNSSASYTGTRVNYAVKDPTGTQYLQPGGTWSGSGFVATHQPFNTLAGASASDTLSLASVTFPSYGIYSVCATWEASCGSDTTSADDLASTCTSLYVVSWGPFADAGHAIPQTTFSQPATVYLGGLGYGAGVGYQVVLYGPAGSAILSGTSASNALAVSQASGALASTGAYEAVVYHSGAAVPAVYNASDPAIIAAAPFTVLPPTPVVSSPSGGTVFPSNTVTIAGTGAAPGSTVSVYIDGVFAGTTTADGSGNFTFTYTFTGGSLGNGAHSVYVTSTDASGSTSAPSTTQAFTVNLVGLLRYGGVTSLSPLTPTASSIFVSYPSDPSLSPSQTLDVPGFNPGAPFPEQSGDLQPASPPLVFYQLMGNTGSTLRVTKSGGVAVITY